MTVIEKIGIAWVIMCGVVMVFSILKYFFFPNSDKDD